MAEREYFSIGNGVLPFGVYFHSPSGEARLVYSARNHTEAECIRQMYEDEIGAILRTETQRTVRLVAAARETSRLIEAYCDGSCSLGPMHRNDFAAAELRAALAAFEGEGES